MELESPAIARIDHGPRTTAERRAPFKLFGGATNQAWRWLNLDAAEACPFLQDYLPRPLGDPEFEERMTNLSGRAGATHAFQIYELFCSLCGEYGAPLSPRSRVLDFGCGWGRVIRYFLKDVAPRNLIGIDTYAVALAKARRTNRWCKFRQCAVLPPTDLASESFDLVYGFSVFSHLSEEAHRKWLAEFARLLRPEGVLILTTFQREFLASFGGHGDHTGRPLSSQDWLTRYDSGGYCYTPMDLQHEHYGNTFIPESYVRETWAEHFSVEEYREAPGLDQNVIVCTKPA